MPCSRQYLIIRRYSNPFYGNSQLPASVADLAAGLTDMDGDDFADHDERGGKDSRVSTTIVTDDWQDCNYRNPITKFEITKSSLKIHASINFYSAHKNRYVSVSPYPDWLC